MKHLSGLDSAFLHLETPETPMHVGSIQLLSLPEGFDGDFSERFKAFIASRMHLAEVFQRKLALMPFDLANPAWVDDDDVDLDYHIRRITLPKPGTMKQLEQYAARLHSSLLDRSRPLWEFYLIDGLNTGQVAFYSKVHHAGVDGQAGVALARALLDTGPEPRTVKPPRTKRKAQAESLGVAELLGAALRNSFVQYLTAAKAMPAFAKGVAAAYKQSRASAAADKALVEAGGAKKPRGRFFVLGPKTPLNGSITNQRSFAGRAVPMAELKRIAKSVDVSLNDVVLAECAGALKRYLAELGCEPKKPLTAAVPVSLRSEGDTQANNQVTGMVVSLATDIADPLERLKAINAASKSAKNVTSYLKALPTDLPMLAAPWLVSGLANLYGRLRIADRLPPLANVAISNVPGPPVALYLAGAHIDAYMPVSIVTHGMALNITVQSYNGQMAYGLTACRRSLPDVGDLADYIVAEHHALLKRVDALAAEQAAAAAIEVTAVPVIEAKPKAAPRKRRPATKLALAASSTPPPAVADAASKKVPTRRRRDAAAA